ncbi:hypothetical protein BRADI_5g23560v3 [Brachypodium distachyon]|uniref:Glutaredoxin domain-containing protein n=1 Tax=Brachypodium distachyon TaxID=15368 RepID=A0A0Q3P7D3_BRADI|nr:hypothetical protein BRADI_5g23560v3 [Brachypodium distachyon]
MGCATSVEAHREMRWVEPPRSSRSFSLPSVDRQRLRAKAASVLGHITAPGRRSGAGGGPTASCKYAATMATLSMEEIMMKLENDRTLAAVLAAVNAKETSAVVTRPGTPPNEPEPEVINAWELMAGLEEEDAPTPRVAAARDQIQTPPLWMMQAGNNADVPPIAFEFDQEILSGFREALAADTSPSAKEEPAQQEKKKDADADADADAGAGTTVSRARASDDMPAELAGIVRARINAFQEKIGRRNNGGTGRVPPGAKRKAAVVYFTSLRGVRKTFVDCCAVRSILRGYGVRVDERDVSMHAAFKAELARLLPGATAPLPRVFVDGRCLGGAEDVHALHEAGELARALEGCEAAPARKLGCMEACAACGDVRFVPCETCKVFVVEDGDEEEDGEFRRCPDCNENGLIGCPVCCC